MTGRRLGAVMSALLLFTACGDQGEPDQPGGPTFTEAQVGFGEAMGQILGHHRVGLELYEAGDLTGAAVHAGHPIHEILDSVTSELDENQASADDLRATLDEVLAAANVQDDLDGINSAMDRAADAVDEAEQAVVGEAAADPAYIGSVIAALTATVAHEYEEAVQDGAIELTDEYQDARGFTLHAQGLFEGIAEDVAAAGAQEAEEVEEAFAALLTALPSAQPPTDPAPLEEVPSATALIGAELEETVGALLLVARDPQAVADRIDELLTQIVDAYAAGDPDAASELAAEAYLDNYELIEAGVIDAAPEVNAELEPLLGAELRRQIDEGAPVADIQTMIDRARELLAEALVALEGA